MTQASKEKKNTIYEDRNESFKKNIKLQGMK